MISLSGSNLYRHDRNDERRDGGVCVPVNERLPSIHLKELEQPEIESLWLFLKPSRLPRAFSCILPTVIYHPPGSDDKVSLKNLTESLDSALKKILYLPFLLLRTSIDLSIANYMHFLFIETSS